MLEKEQLIWERFTQGDRQSLSLIYDQHYGSLVNYVRRFTTDTLLLEECIQDLFVKLWLNRENLGKPVSVRLYLLKSIRHIVYNKLGTVKRIRFVGSQQDLLPFELRIRPATDSDPAHRKEPGLSTRMRKIIAQLTPRQREAIYLIYFEDLTYEEASGILGITVKATYKLIYRAIGEMKEIFFQKNLLHGVNVLLATVLLIE